MVAVKHTFCPKSRSVDQGEGDFGREDPEIEGAFYEDDNTPGDGRNLHQADRLPEAVGHEEWSDFWVTEMWAEQDKETSGDHLAMMTSMSGFKFAVSFLFNSATEVMGTASEVTVLSILWTLQPSKLCKPGVVND